jgi:hypothetical protein
LDLRRRFESLERVKAPGSAVKGVYTRVERLAREERTRENVKAEEKHPGSPRTGFRIAGFLPSLTAARAALFASLVTLCIAVPAAFFFGLNSRRGTTGPEKIYVVRLVFENRNAESVSVIGDFNNWQKGAAEMQKVPGTSLWAIEIPLQEGLYRYAFLVDEKEWKADPLARAALKDDFGKVNSLIVLKNGGEGVHL